MHFRCISGSVLPPCSVVIFLFLGPCPLFFFFLFSLPFPSPSSPHQHARLIPTPRTTYCSLSLPRLPPPGRPLRRSAPSPPSLPAGLLHPALPHAASSSSRAAAPPPPCSGRVPPLEELPCRVDSFAVLCLSCCGCCYIFSARRPLPAKCSTKFPQEARCHFPTIGLLSSPCRCRVPRREFSVPEESSPFPCCARVCCCGSSCARARCHVPRREVVP